MQAASAAANALVCTNKGNHHEYYSRNFAGRGADALPSRHRFWRCCDDDDRIYLGRLGHRRHCQNYERNGREQRSDGVAQFTTADGAVAKFKAAGPYSKDTVIGEFVKTVASTNMDYSFAKACAAGVEAELSRTAAKS